MFFPKEKVQSLLNLNGLIGNVATDAVMALTGIHRINRVFRPLDRLSGIDFAQASLKELGVDVNVSQDDLYNIPHAGACIICVNHPYGCIDGLMMLATVGKVRRDVLIMTNFILSSIPCLADSFIAVDPFSTGKARSVKGVRNAIMHLRKGGCLVIFPAGEVSSNRNPQHVVKDIEWHSGAMRVIRNAEVPVVPAFFSGMNSKFFHAIGAIHPFLRTIRLPWEMLNKRGNIVDLKFGKVVNPSEFSSYTSHEELGAYLRNRTYAMEGLLYGENNPVILKNQSPIEKHVDSSILAEEVRSQEKNILFRDGGFSCYLSRYDEIPNMIHEIGVCREETFRKNNEGTGKSIDLDKYDEYYLHMFLWNDDENELVGAYRVGVGGEIMPKYGIRGFYSDLFFHFKDDIALLLEESIELGRSFIVEKYQAVPNTLKLLLNKGLGKVIGKFPTMYYFLGPASISSNYSPLFGSLIVEYLKRTRTNAEYSSMIEPDVPFVPTYHNVDIDSIGFEKLSIDQFDKTLRRFSDGRFRLPPLIRAYVKAGGTFLGFNVDPGFNYCIDALVLTAFDDIPADQMS